MSIKRPLSRFAHAMIRPGIGAVQWGNSRYDTVVNHGDPKNRLDVAIVGDGYAAADMPLFDKDVEAIVNAFHTVEPIRTYWPHFNFHRINLISKTTGVNDCYQQPPIRTTSPLGTHFSFIDQRRLVGWDWRVWQVAKQSGVPFDALLVVVNTPRRGGATRFWMTVAYASRNSIDFPRIMIHEAGHSIAKLNDEYVDRLMPRWKWLRHLAKLPNLMPFANVSTNPKRPPWHRWLSAEKDAPNSTIGCYEGASFMPYGLYRPAPTCLMREHQAPFCPICQEQWIKRIYLHSPIADGRDPDGDQSIGVGGFISFNATCLRHEAIETIWRIRDPNGIWKEVQKTADYKPFRCRFNHAGRWIIRCDLSDRSSRLRQSSVIKRSAQKILWAIIVQE